MEGQTVPAFQLQDEAGNTYSSDALLGKKYILYFYPKDDTPGCTVEACSFRDHLSAFTSLDVQVFGISKGTMRTHKAFKENHSLTFPLLLDADSTVAKAFGVLTEKSMFGKKYMGIQRDTFLILENGRIGKVWHNVNPSTHTEEIVSYLSQK